MFENIWIGITSSLSPLNFFAMLFGLIYGMIMGSLPGITSTTAMAIFVPFTFLMPPGTGLLCLASIYTAATYGGSISAILLRIPGTPASIATTWDGYELSKKGKAGKALFMATMTSSLGGFISALALLFFAPPLAKIALKFWPPEIFALAILGLSCVSALCADSIIKGAIACTFGLLIGTIGQDPVSGFPRFTFGQPFLLQGVALIPALIGFFSIPQVLSMIEQEMSVISELGSGRWRLSWIEFKNSFMTYIRGSFIGVVIGILPAAAPDVAAYISYNEARRASKHPETYGKGELDGVAASETANNACTGGDIIPTITLSIPGSPAAAVMLGTLYIHGLLPGPMLFTQHINVVYTFFMGFIWANLLIFPVGLLMSRLGTKILRMPVTLVGPLVVVLCVVGSFSLNFNLFDIWIMFGAGILGYVMGKYGFPVAPVILALVLGPMAETSLNQTLLIGFGSPAIFLRRPIALTLLGFAALTLISPYLPAIIRRCRGWLKGGN